MDGLHLLSKVARSCGHGEDSAYFDGWKAYDRNPYHPARNPGGVIQMGLAENQLSFDLIQEWVKEHPEASICTSQGAGAFGDVAAFQYYEGLPAFRNAIAKFMGRVRGGRVVFDADRIVMSGGATGANEAIIFCLADPGDVFLVPSLFDRDVRWRTGVKIIAVACGSSNGFQITTQALEQSYRDATAQGTNVKGLILTNPSNPLGTLLDRQTLKDILKFVNDKNIHLVCDEIYAATAFSAAGFLSVANIVEDMEPAADINLDLIHIVYSFSKDLGLPGFRIGVIYSYNDNVVTCARRMSSFALVSSQTQHFIACMLSDDTFVDKFLRESSKRLEARHAKFTTGLMRVGIQCLKSSAGLFCWMDLRKLLDRNDKECAEDDEARLWRVIIDEVKLNVSPGSSFHCTEPGWFRTMEVALKRIWAFVGRKIGPDVKTKKHRENHVFTISKSSKRLSFEDDNVLSPILSHSPPSQMVHTSYF
uniref:1-aminocyclopropane-1-carboxylate synthase n=1 Tax=Kalanchoe fedtschenkoi TaxID=63787 RepID=A0A7N1A3A7_KALFE